MCHPAAYRIGPLIWAQRCSGPKVAISKIDRSAVIGRKTKGGCEGVSHIRGCLLISTSNALCFERIPWDPDSHRVSIIHRRDAVPASRWGYSAVLIGVHIRNFPNQRERHERKKYSGGGGANVETGNCDNRPPPYGPGSSVGSLAAQIGRLWGRACIDLLFPGSKRYKIHFFSS